MFRENFSCLNSRKVFTVFKSVLKMPKIAEIVATWAGSNPGTLEWVGRLDSLTSANQTTEIWRNLTKHT
jgi:hypothetical protein